MTPQELKEITTRVLADIDRFWAAKKPDPNYVIPCEISTLVSCVTNYMASNYPTQDHLVLLDEFYRMSKEAILWIQTPQDPTIKGH